MAKLPDSPALAQLKWLYYQYAASCALFNRTPERVGQWFTDRYIKEGVVYTVGTGTDLFYTDDPRLCWRTIGHWLRAHCYEHNAPGVVREVGDVDAVLSGSIGSNGARC